MSDFSPATGIEWGNGGVGQVQYNQGDRELHVTFHRFSERNGVAAIAAGKPAFVAKDYVRIFRPAEYKLHVLDREATEEDKHRFPRHWAAYQASMEQVPDGYPIVFLFPHDPDVVDRLKASRVHTVEQLAGISDGAGPALGLGWRDLVEKARDYMETAPDRDRAAAADERFEQQQATIEMLKRELESIKQREAA